MTRVLVLKLLRDVRLALLAVGALLFLFEMLWARVTYTITIRILSIPFLRQAKPVLEAVLFEGPGKIIQTLMGGEGVDLTRAQHTISIGFVHPLVQTILCIWGVGRASGAIAGEVDRGTMELLLAQPVPRNRLILAHLIVDLIVIPVLCLAMWLGSVTGLALFELLNNPDSDYQVDPRRLVLPLLSHALLIFAVSGLTLALSAAGRFRYRVLGQAILVILVMFLVNLLGQMWDPIQPLRPLTIFYYFNPQPMILDPEWYLKVNYWLSLGVLMAVGAGGYLAALRVFCRRDLPAPL